MTTYKEQLQICTFTFPPRIEFGIGAVKNLGKWVKNFQSKTPFIITDEGIVKAGILTKIQNSLEDASLQYEVYDKVQPNPLDQNVNEGATLYRKGTYDLIIGLGGGSPIDAAKGIQVLATVPGPINKYYIDNNPPEVIPAVKLIAIPTTAGTGSEVGTGGVITDSQTNRKRFVRSGRPNLALVDPELMKTMPPPVTAGTGMDALSHCIEAYVSINYSPIADGIALKGIQLIEENLRLAVKDGTNMEARTNMAMAATMGGLAMSKDLGVIHSVSHQLSTQRDIPHGVANSIMLSHGMRFNLEVAMSKYADISYAFGVDISGIPMEESAVAAINAIRQLSQDIGLPQKLSEVGVQREDIPLMAKNAMLDFVHATNPRRCSEEDMIWLYEQAY
ncbi:MAG: iron-containing alcohol dehydrogenase family protein [Candidatus Heimdallarchaeota archaeon]